MIYMAGPMDGYGTCAIHQHYAAKITVLMVISVSNPDVTVTSSCNPEVPSVYSIVKVTIVMVMSSGNWDVMSHP